MAGVKRKEAVAKPSRPKMDASKRVKRAKSSDAKVHPNRIILDASDDLIESDTTESDSWEGIDANQPKAGHGYHDEKVAARRERSKIPKKPLKTKAEKIRIADAESEELIESDTTESETHQILETVDGRRNHQLAKGDVREKSSGAQSISKEIKPSPTDLKIDAKTAYVKGMPSQEAHSRQKTLTQHRKSLKPNADGIQRAKKLWERLRRKSHVPLAERKELVAELFDIVTGRVNDFVFKHDAVRVVQTAIKYANREQRRMIARELRGSYRSLAESKYAKFLIGKLLVHGDVELREMIIPEFYGQVRRMMRHPEAAWLLDDVYRGVASSTQKARLLREWYGPEYALLTGSGDDEATSKLSELLAMSPEKRMPMMRSLHESINRLVQKKSTGFTMLHDAMLEYFLNVKRGGEEMTAFLELLKDDDEGDLLKNLAFTPSGSRIVCLALALGTAKDRKVVLRAYKDIMQLLANDAHGHRILLAAYETIDDTVLSAKVIFTGLLGRDDSKRAENIVDLATRRPARTALLYLPAGRQRHPLTPATVALLDEVDDARRSTSKKEPWLRREELLKALSPSLLGTVVDHGQALGQSPLGCAFISDVLLGCVGEKQPALEAVADLAGGDPTADGHLAHAPTAGRMLKALVLGGYYHAATGKVHVVDPSLNFHGRLYDRIRPHVLAWAGSPSAFVIVGLLEAPDFGARAKLLQTLREHRSQLEAVTGPESIPAAVAATKQGRTSEQRPPGDYHVIGHRGARLILEKLDSSS